MRFLFIISHDDSFRPIPGLLADIGAWVDRQQAAGVRIDGQPLVPAGQAVTVRVRGGRVQASEGPFSEAAEQMCAYELVECPGMDEAVALAASHPMAAAATIEVRPLWDAMRTR